MDAFVEHSSVRGTLLRVEKVRVNSSTVYLNSTLFWLAQELHCPDFRCMTVKIEPKHFQVRTILGKLVFPLPCIYNFTLFAFARQLARAEPLDSSDSFLEVKMQADCLSFPCSPSLDTPYESELECPNRQNFTQYITQ